MNISREELEALCSELGRVYNILREDDRDANIDLLRNKMLSCWKEMQFYIDNIYGG